MKKNEHHQPALKSQVFSLLCGIAVLCNALWFGCVAPENVRLTSEKVDVEFTVSGEQIYELLISDYSLVPSQGASIADRSYGVPSLSWYKNSFHRAVQYRLEHKKAFVETGDCDDYSFIAKSVASELNWGNNSSLPVGYFGFIQESGNGHAIICFIYEEDMMMRVGFYDPQLGGNFVQLTRKEMDECIVWFF
jgi:hypothetical protein